MSLIQKPAETPEELEASLPLTLTPDEVQKLNEREWYTKVYRGDVPQLTFRSIATGTVLGFFLSFTNIYVGLKTGWFLGVALTACILSYAISTFFHKAGLWKSPMTILENNCMQSTASAAGYSTGSTLVSAVPAMIMLSVNDAHPGGVQKPWYILAPWVFSLACLGVMLAIPMKRSLINRERLRFPQGTAAAATLQGLYSQGAEALAKARVLGATALFSAIVKVLTDLKVRTVIDPKTLKAGRAALLPGESNIFDWIRDVLPESLRTKMKVFTAHGAHAPTAKWNLSDWTMGIDHGFVLVAAGMIVGIRTTTWMVIGGLFLAFYLGPVGLEAEWINANGKLVTAVTVPAKAWRELGLWVAGPMMVTYGLTAFAGQWRTIARSIGGLKKVKVVEAKNPEDERADAIMREIEIPTTWFLGGAAAAGSLIVLLGWRFMEIPPLYGALAVLLAFVLGLVACRATGETDITPSGALGKLMQLLYGKLIPQSSTANLMTASITAGSGLAAADLLNDLKSGYLLGANPRRQFLAQASGILTGTVASTLGFFLLVPDASVLLGVDGKKPAFPAPGAQQWKAAAELFQVGIQNFHPLARRMIFIGLALGVVLAIAEMALPKYKKWIPSATGLGLGLMLPFPSPLAMFLGAVFAEVATKVNKSWAARFIVPISAGTIAGESLIGVVVQALNNFVFK